MAIGRSMGGILGICIGGILFAATIPTAVTAVNEANTTGWTTAQAAIWPVVGIIILVAGIASFIPDYV